MAYILEVQRFIYDGHKLHPEWNGKCEHIGYMNIIFKTKQQACSYYDKHNPHMRSLNAHNNWRSDYDPNTYLLYIVRERGEEYLKLPTFVEKDEKNNIILNNNQIIEKFISEMIIQTNDKKDKIGKCGLIQAFKQWFEQSQGSRKAPKGQELYEAMNKRFGFVNAIDGKWHGIKFNDPADNDDDF